MRKWLRTLIHDEQGLTTIEYALLLALIVAAGVMVWQTFGKTVNNSGMHSTTSISQAEVE